MANVMNMTRGKPARLMLKFALPVVLTNLGQQLYQIVDAAIVGRGVGVDALAAVGCTDWTYWMIMWGLVVMTQGFATFVSRYFGQNDPEKINKAITASVYLSVIISGVFLVGGVLLTRPILVMLKTPEEGGILAQAVTYLTTMLCGLVIVALYNLTAAILRAFGDSKSPMVAMVIAAGLNILLDLLFVFGFRWGVFGAAMASVLSQCVALVFCAVKIFRISIVKLDKAAWQWDGALSGEMAKFGIPLALQYVIINFGGMLLQSTVNLQGAAFVAGYTAVNKLYGLLECTGISLGAAFSTYASQNYGAGNYLRVRKGVNVGMVLAVGMAMILASITLPLRRLLPQLFIDMTEPGAAEAVDIASRYLMRMILSLPILYLVYVHRHNLQAVGNSSWSLISGIAESVSRVVMAKVLFDVVGVEILFYTEPVAWLLAWLFVLVPYYWYQKRKLPV